jgi:hypothetical protein
MASDRQHATVRTLYQLATFTRIYAHHSLVVLYLGDRIGKLLQRPPPLFLIAIGLQQLLSATPPSFSSIIAVVECCSFFEPIVPKAHQDARDYLHVIPTTCSWQCAHH